MQKLSLSYSRWVENNRLLLVSILGLVTIFFTIQLLGLKVNPSLFLLDKSHEGRIYLSQSREHFTGSGEQIVVAVVTKKESIFNRHSLNSVASLSETFRSLSLVEEHDHERVKLLAVDDNSQRLVDSILTGGINYKDKRKLSDLLKYYESAYPTAIEDVAYLQDMIIRAAPVIRIRSIANVENIELNGETLDIHDLMEAVPESDKGIAKLENEAYDNNLFIDSLISVDRKSTMIQIELSVDEEDSYKLQKMYSIVLDIVDKFESEDSFHVAGYATYLAAITEIVEKDNNKFFPFVVLVVALLLYASFRRWQGVWIPLIISVVTLIWTMGTVNLLGFKLNIITNMIPVFLIAISVADAIHFLSSYYKAAESSSKTEAVAKSLDHLMVPMLLTTVTTFFGFIALSVSNLSFIREFGIFVAIGVLFAFVITVTLLPLLLPFLKTPQKSIAESNQNSMLRMIDKFGLSLNRLSAARPGIVFAIFSTLVIGAGWFASQIVVDNENIASFSESTRVRQDHKVLNTHFGGTLPVSIWFETESKDTMKTPEMMALVRDIQKRVQSHETIGYTISYVNYLDRIHEVMSGDGSDRMPVDAGQDLISQYFLLYEFGQGSEILDVVDYDYMNARIIALSYTDKGSSWQAVNNDIQAYADSILPEGVTVHIVGTGESSASVVPEIINGQIQSFIISMVLISILMVVIFRSLVLGSIGIIPLTSTIIVLGGFMSLVGIPLDIGTSMICGICFGVGIDYTIHFISVFKRYFLETNGDWDVALRDTMAAVCRPIVVNSLTLSFGFSMLTFSDYAAIRNLGLLVGCSMILCAIFSLLLLPTLLRLVKPKVLVSKLDEFSVAVVE